MITVRPRGDALHRNDGIYRAIVQTLNKPTAADGLLLVTYEEAQ
jgi:hypothetical protein